MKRHIAQVLCLPAPCAAMRQTHSAAIMRLRRTWMRKTICTCAALNIVALACCSGPPDPRAATADPEHAACGWIYLMFASVAVESCYPPNLYPEFRADLAQGFDVLDGVIVAQNSPSVARHFEITSGHISRSGLDRYYAKAVSQLQTYPTDARARFCSGKNADGTPMEVSAPTIVHSYATNPKFVQSIVDDALGTHPPGPWMCLP